jgi:single-strand DNA-binding protein
MSSDINKVILIGRLTKDPELKYTQASTAVCSFSIANNKTYVTGGEKKEQVSYFNCVAWAKTAEVIAEYCKKGQRIAIDGRLQQRSWDDQDGKKRQTVEVVVETFQFLSDKKTGEQQQGTGPEPPFGDNPFSDDSEIPF